MKKPLQSEAILRLLDASLEVEDSVTQHGPRVAKRLEERFAPYFAHLGDGQRPNFLATFFALRDELGGRRGRGSLTARGREPSNSADFAV